MMKIMKRSAQPASANFTHAPIRFDSLRRFVSYRSGQGHTRDCKGISAFISSPSSKGHRQRPLQAGAAHVRASGTGKLVLHNLDRSRSYRVIWLLEELGVPFEIKQYDRDPNGPNPVSNGFKIHPLGKFPMIETEDGEVIVETGAIFEYLLRVYDPENKISASPGTRESERLNYWFHYAEGGLQLWSQCAFFFATQKKEAPQKLVDEVNTNLKFLNDILGKQEWIAGDTFSAADVVLEFPVEFAEPLPKIDYSQYPNLQAWQKRVKERAGFKQAMEKNGEYDLKSLYALF